MAESPASSKSSVRSAESVTYIQMDVGSSDVGKKAEEDAERVVEILLTDVLICSLCSQQFPGIVDFLLHKANHTMLSCNYRCELCKSTFTRQAALLNHYKKKHRVSLPVPVVEVPSPSKPVKKQKTVPDRANRAARTMGIDELMLPLNNSIDNEPVSRSSSSDGADDMEVADDEASTVPVMENNVTENSSAISDQEVPLKSSEKLSAEQDFYFILQTEVVKGRSMEYGVASFKCLHCDYKTEARKAITAHMDSWHSELLSLNQSIETRPQVSKKFCVENQKLMSMSQYEATYGELRLKKKTQDSQGRPPRALEKQDIPGIYPCSKCDKVFSRVRYLKKHALTHANTREYTCEKCGKGFKCQTYLTVHRKIHKEKEFKCSQCDFRSTLKSAIHEHRQLHSEGSVLCDICGFAYNDKSTLAKHKQVHDPARPFACTFPECTWRFKSDTMCRAHVRSHTSEGKFKCNTCGYRFRHKHHLQRHETAMHGIKHLKSRGQHKPADTIIDTSMADTISFVVNTDLTAEQFQALSQNQLVVATDTDGTPIAVEASDLSSLTSVLQYQALMQNVAEVQAATGKSLDLAVMDGNNGAVLLSQENI